MRTNPFTLAEKPFRNRESDRHFMIIRGLNALADFTAPTNTGPAHAETSVWDIFPLLAPGGLVKSNLPATSGSMVPVDSWASRCAPCKTSLPAYARPSLEFASEGLVSVDQDSVSYASFVGKFNPPFFVTPDRSQRLVRITQVPTTPTGQPVDRAGRSEYARLCFRGADTEQRLRREIEMPLSGKFS
jgi:hypothetical protein